MAHSYNTKDYTRIYPGMGKCKQSIILIGQSAFTQNLIGQRVRRIHWETESVYWKSPSVNTLRHPVKEVYWEVFGVGCLRTSKAHLKLRGEFKKF